MRMIDLRIPNGRMAFGEVPEHIDQRLQEAVNKHLSAMIGMLEELLEGGTTMVQAGELRADMNRLLGCHIPDKNRIVVGCLAGL